MTVMQCHCTFYGNLLVKINCDEDTADPTLFVCFWRNSPQWAMASSFTRFLDHTQRHTTVGRTPLDEQSARRKDLYLTTHSTHNRETSTPPVGFEPTISAGERPYTYVSDRAATRTGCRCNIQYTVLPTLQRLFTLMSSTFLPTSV